MHGLLASLAHLSQIFGLFLALSLFNRITESPPPRAWSFFFFLFGFFGLDKNNNPVWKHSFLHCLLPFDTFTIPDYLIRPPAYNFINSPRLVFVWILSFRPSWRAWRSVRALALLQQGVFFDKYLQSVLVPITCFLGYVLLYYI